MGRSSRLHRFAAATIVLLLSTTVALALAEAATRLFFPAFDPSGQFDFDHEVGPLMLARPGTVTRQVKNTGDYDVEIRINRRGLRDARDIAEATPADLIVVGDSVAWGWGIEESRRFSNLIEAATAIRTFNLSCPANLQGYADLLAYARSLGAKPGRVVIAVSMETDLRAYAPAPSDGTASAPQSLLEPVKSWLDSHSAAYLFAVTTIHRTPWLNALAVRAGLIVPSLEGIWGNHYSAEIIAGSADKLQEIARGQPTLIVLVPSRGLWAGNNRPDEDHVHRALVAALEKRGLDVLDLRPLLEAGGAPLVYHFANDGHWNERGHRLAAEAIVARLKGGT
ncbi:MAG TPA: hypothetical protein VMI56_11180 [Reyranella sp.]|nr:hypothetical protein [Reyranella sp.]